MGSETYKAVDSTEKSTEEEFVTKGMMEEMEAFLVILFYSLY